MNIHKTLKNKKIEFPLYFPVISPVESSYDVEVKARALIPHVSDYVLISSYNLLKNPKLLGDHTVKKILNDCFVFIDSGGFLISDLRKEKEDVIVYFDDFSTSWKSILDVQNRFGQIANNVDVIKLSGRKTSELIEINSFFIDQYLSTCKDFMFFPTIHAHEFQFLKAYCQRLSKCSENFDGISVGGLVLLKNNWERILEHLFFIKHFFKNTLIHAFGVGNPALLPVIYSMGITSVDSSSYLRYALDLKYIHPKSFQVLDIPLLNEDLPCDCKICQIYSKSDLISMGGTGKAFIAIHNLYAYAQLSKLFRSNDRDLLKDLSLLNPFIAKTAKFFEKIKNKHRNNSN